MFKILTNTFINQYRKQQRDREVIEDWDWEQIMPTDSDPQSSEREILDRFVSREVVDALAKVPVDFRVVVILADLEDFSYKEIADIAGCPIGTVMSRLYRGRRLLRKLLYDYALEQGYIEPQEESIEPMDADGNSKVTALSSYRLQRERAKQKQAG